MDSQFNKFFAGSTYTAKDGNKFTISLSTGRTVYLLDKGASYEKVQRAVMLHEEATGEPPEVISYEACHQGSDNEDGNKQEGTKC